LLLIISLLFRPPPPLSPPFPYTTLFRSPPCSTSKNRPNPLAPALFHCPASYSALHHSRRLVGKPPSIPKACGQRIFSVTMPAGFKRLKSIARFMALQALQPSQAGTGRRLEISSSQ